MHWLVERHTVFACVVGSRAYGLDTDESDVDLRGVFVAPTPMFWRLAKPPTHIEGPAPEQFSWEVERYCVLALQANPTVLECLWSPLIEVETEVGRSLRQLRGAFLSTRVGQTYGGYAHDQLARLTNARARTGQVRWKQAMHMLRLLQAGLHVLRTGEILVDVRADRDRLLAVRRGEVDFDEVQRWATRLFDDLVAARDRTALPAEPDRGAVDDFLVRVRRASVDEPGEPGEPGEPQTEAIEGEPPLAGVAS